MRVWIVNPFDNLPLEGYRPQRYWLMARAFARAGHDVVLWTSDFSHAHKRPRAFVAGRTAEGDGFRLELVPTPPYPRNICLRRVRSHRAFAKRWRARAEGMAEKPDVVVASLPPLASGVQALAFCRAAGARFVLDVMDAWPENFARVVPSCLLFPLRRVARGLYRGADAVRGGAERYVELARGYGARGPVRLAWHGIELPARIPDPGSQIPESGAGTIPESAVPESGAGELRLVYAGTMGASYDLETAVACVEGLPDVSLDLAGTGPKEAALRRLAAGCPRIRFHGYLRDAELRALLARADAALVPMFDASCVGVPYKLADYAAAGLPVLNSLHGETERLLAEHGAGFTYAAGDALSLREAVARLWRETVRDGGAALRAGAAALAARFDADRVYGGYVAWVESLGVL